MIIRLGYLGTFLNLSLFIYLMVFFYKKRANHYALASFLFFFMSFGISFFTWNLTQTITYILPIISYHIVYKTEKEKQDDQE
jgi:predicted membrane protein